MTEALGLQVAIDQFVQTVLPAIVGMVVVVGSAVVALLAVKR